MNREKIEQLMKQCQRGVAGGKTALDDANNLLAECYGTMGAMMLQVDDLTRSLNRPDETIAPPVDDLPALRIQYNALRTLYYSALKQREHWRNQSGDTVRQAMTQNVASINALRDTNEQLTNALLAAEAERDALKAQVASDEVKLDALLNHCDKDNSECMTCSQIICPHKCELHLHHDGCPACAQDEAA